MEAVITYSAQDVLRIVQAQHESMWPAPSGMVWVARHSTYTHEISFEAKPAPNGKQEGQDEQR